MAQAQHPADPVVAIPDRFAFGADDYLNQTGLNVYLSDCVLEILNGRHEQPLLALQQYFQKIVDRTHIHGREFAFIDATARNRLSLVRSFESTFACFEPNELLVAEDVHQLLCIVCPDFPIDIVRSSLKPFSSTKLPYALASRSVSLYIFYRRFLESIQEIFVGASGGGGRPGGDTFSSSVVLRILTTLFYDDTGGKSAQYYRAQTASLPRTHDRTFNDDRFEEVAGEQREQNVYLSQNKIGLCIPPFWSVKEAVEKAATGRAKEPEEGSEGGKQTEVTEQHTGDPGVVSWSLFLKQFLLNNKVLLQLQNKDPQDDGIKIHPPTCAIATSAVTSEHEAASYRLMRALVSSNVGNGSGSSSGRSVSNKRNESNSSSNSSTGSGKKNRKRGKSAGRRR